MNLLVNISQNSFSPGLRLGNFGLDPAVFLIQVVDNIIIIIVSVVIHVVVLKEARSTTSQTISVTTVKLLV